MNTFKFSDCRYCEFVGHGGLARECRTCSHGENFEEHGSEIGGATSAYEELFEEVMGESYEKTMGDIRED